MRISANGLVLGLLFTINFISGCDDTETATPSTGATTGKSDTVNLQGSVFKGLVDRAMLQVTDTSGAVLATGQSNNGRFEINAVPIPDQKIVFIKSLGGNYVDEASGQTVNLDSNTGLMTVFSHSELQSLAQNGQPVTLTPESTLVAKLVSKLVEQQPTNGMSESQAIRHAENLVNTQLIAGTSPLPGAVTDSVMRIGDAASTRPVNQIQALARNRAISFSYEAKNRGLAPHQVFELLDKRAADLFDGRLDGKQVNMPITMVDTDGNNVAFEHQKTTYGMARAELLNSIVDRYVMGQGSADEHAELEAMGMDLAQLDQMQQQFNQAPDITTANLTASNLPDFQFLPVLQDEDGNLSDSAAAYTLDAMENVNVTIQTPSGSWITPMMRYNGLQRPPVIIARRGDQMTFTVNNQLNEATTVHWHGFKIPADQDGGPDFPIAANASKIYRFTMLQAAAPLWFHPHPHEHTATQVYNGLAGGFVLRDNVTDRLENTKQLPSGNQDISLLIQDRRFSNDDGTGVRPLIYDDTMRTTTVGMLGDHIMVNDVVLPKLNVDTRQYRFRIYNGSNARTYNIALHDNTTFHVVATDGGLLPSPVETDRLLLSSGERAEIVIDFGVYSPGDKVMLVSRPFTTSPMTMMMSSTNTLSGQMHRGGGTPGGDGTTGGSMPGSGMSGGVLLNGAAFDIMRFDVTSQLADDVTLYTALPNDADIYNRLTADQADRHRDFIMSMGMSPMGGSGTTAGMAFLINGKLFDINRVDEVVPSGATEIWTIRNASMMAHPFHAHAIQWQILNRNRAAATGIDLGWKDTVLVQPGETVQIMGRFDPVVNRGKYMYHCHILEHESAGMMGTFEVQ